MINAFEMFCNLKGLKINVGKTKAMQINMAVDFTCNKLPIENVNEFKYLGLVINRAHNSPTTMLEKRISKAVSAFNSIKCHARLLGLTNRRVRV
jgi:vancomycin permeability regulator SanA